MGDSQSLHLEQRMGLRLSQSQLRFVKLLEMTSPEMEEAVARELEDNPALGVVDNVLPEERQAGLTDDGAEFKETSEQIQKADYANSDDIPYYRLNVNNYSPDDDGYDATVADEGESLYDNLNAQLAERHISPDLCKLASYIIGSLDSNGYLRSPLHSLVDDLAFNVGVETTTVELQKALEIVQSLDPVGIGASDLRECLLPQLEHLPSSKRRDDALVIIRDHFEPFSMKHSHKIISAMHISSERLADAMSLIKSLNPKPGSVLESELPSRMQTIIPDFVISVEDGEISVSLTNRIPDLKIEESFASAVARMEANAKNRNSRKGSEFVTSRFNDARDFIRVVRQRQETLFAVMTAIVKIQKEYFLTEDVRRMRPMLIKDVAAMTGYDISVISRATNNKYAATPWGTFPLRFFFTDSFGEDGDELTNKEVAEIITSIVRSEDKRHPLSDERIREEMLAKGYDVSRRTVAKYRDREGIPVARLRKEM
jgi:RNA polymerase sigma-54 factor